MPDPIVIVESDPMWPAEFERLRTRIAGAVGDVAVAVEHVGSTAVPGLAAKPVIDMVVVVEPHDLQTAIERLVAIGYVHQGNLGVEGREAFGVPEGERRHHLYVSPTDSEELRAQLAFRDRLRANRELAAKYERAEARTRGAVPRRPRELHRRKDRFRGCCEQTVGLERRLRQRP